MLIQNECEIQENIKLINISNVRHLNKQNVKLIKVKNIQPENIL